MVEAVGPGVTEVAVGDRVVLRDRAGRRLLRRRATCRRRSVVKLPAGIDDRTAASMMVRGQTARYLLHETYKVKPGDTILVHAAAGGVGLILCQWAKHLGATVIGTVSTDEKATVAKAHGCDHPIVYTREDFTARVKEITKAARACRWSTTRSGYATLEGSMKCLRLRGVLASFGEASGDPDPVPPRQARRHGLDLAHPSARCPTTRRRARN